MTRLRVGPIPTEGAHAWIDNTLGLLAALERSPLLPFALVEETVEAMRARVFELQALVDEGHDEIEWECEMDAGELRALLTYWVNIGQLPDETVAAVGAGWGTEEAERFHGHLIRSVIDGLASIDAAYAARLERAWRPPTVDLTAGEPGPAPEAGRPASSEITP